MSRTDMPFIEAW